jgi:hypothetical protein
MHVHGNKKGLNQVHILDYNVDESINDAEIRGNQVHSQKRSPVSDIMIDNDINLNNQSSLSFSPAVYSGKKSHLNNLNKSGGDQR